MVKDIEQLNTRGRKMNVLEKILEEIDRLDEPYYVGYVDRGKVKEIIHSHMDDVTDTNVGSKNNWIPCSERLPEEGKEVLAQFVVRVRHTNGKVDEAVYIYPLYYEEGKWKSFHGMPNGKVEAWQPLPEPYKGEEAAGE